MAILERIFSWVLCLIFIYIAIIMFQLGGYFQFVTIILIVLFVFPPLRIMIYNMTGIELIWWGRAIVIILLSAIVMMSIISSPTFSIFKSTIQKTHSSKNSSLESSHESNDSQSIVTE